MDAVAEEVDALGAGVDAEFDPVDDSDVVADGDRGVEGGVEAVVVGDRDGGDARVVGGVGDGVDGECAIGVGGVDVEIRVNHTDRRWARHLNVVVGAADGRSRSTTQNTLVERARRVQS